MLIEKKDKTIKDVKKIHKSLESDSIYMINEPDTESHSSNPIYAEYGHIYVFSASLCDYLVISLLDEVWGWGPQRGWSPLAGLAQAEETSALNLLYSVAAQHLNQLN